MLLVIRSELRFKTDLRVCVSAKKVDIAKDMHSLEAFVLSCVASH